MAAPVGVGGVWHEVHRYGLHDFALGGFPHKLRCERVDLGFGVTVAGQNRAAADILCLAVKPSHHLYQFGIGGFARGFFEMVLQMPVEINAAPVVDFFQAVGKHLDYLIQLVARGQLFGHAGRLDARLLYGAVEVGV